MMRTVTFVLLVALCASRPSDVEDQLGLFSAEESSAIEVRAVVNPTTPNQILDAIIEGALGYIKAAGWDSSKNVKSGESTLPFKVNSDESSSEKFEITSASLTGLGSLTRSKSASFNSDKSVLKGTVMVKDARVLADYTAIFPGVGEAPANTVSGEVTERVDKLFADIEVNLKDLIPQSIKSYSVRSGHDVLEKATNLAGSDMETLDKAGFRKGLREILEKTMATNVKVQINKAIQDMKATTA